MTTQSTTRTAQEAFDDKASLIRAELERIGADLDKYIKSLTTGARWGNVGDIGQMLNHLKAATDCLNGKIV